MATISIVLPTKNSEKYISKTLDSVQAQNFLDWELLVCDSKSSDNTLKIINERIKKDNRIKIVSNFDHGVSDALNIGFKSASGKIYAWLNSDDFYSSDTVLELVKKNLLDQNNFDYFVGDFFNVDEDGNKFKSFISYIPKEKVVNHFFYNQIFTGSLFFTSKSYKDFGGFNLKYKYAFEYDLLFYLIKNYYGKHVNIFLSCFRISKNQLSSNKLKLKSEMFEILKFYKLNYSNSKFSRIKSYFLQGSLIRFIYYKIYDLIIY